ncbi:MAG: recombination mediator RecR [Bacteroidota bacterium]|nr:recombination mediator RecR [Bacteroidota bacterium]
MEISNYPSVLLEQAVNEFSKFPGIGKRTALRLVLHLLNQDKSEIEHFSKVIDELGKNLKFCSICHNISDTEICNICADRKRDHSTICVVENVRDVMAIENTNQYGGVYHVLGGIISPMDGIGPGDLHIHSLVERVAGKDIKELILALPTTMEGDTTSFYLYRKLADYDVDITSIARGVAVGDELQYADEITLGRSIVNRVAFKANED